MLLITFCKLDRVRDLLTTSAAGGSGETIKRHSVLTKTWRVMQVTAFILLVFTLHVAAKGVSQTITLSGTDLPLKTVIAEIEKQSGYLVIYNKEMIEDAKPVTVYVKEEPLIDFLDATFSKRGLEYVIENKSIIIKKEATLFEKLVRKFTPPIDIVARVTDEEGNPLAGANIKVVGSNKMAVTDADGMFKLKGVDADSKLEISYVGYTKSIVSAKNGAIKLTRNDNKLDEVQYIAYGQTSKRFSVGNVTTVKAAEIEKQPVRNPMLALQGRVPGLEVTQLTGLNGGAVTVRIQGRNSINGGLEPLIVIDGVPYPSVLANTDMEGSIGAAFFLRGGSPLNYVNPADIESIDVLKDADATAIYGSRAGNGAILITTKKGRSGKAKLGVNLQQGWGKVTRKVDMLNTRQYLDMRYEALRNNAIDLATVTPSGLNYDLTLWDTTRYTDWQEELIGGTARYTNVGASISGGTASMQYLMGGTFNRETTVFPGSFDDKNGSLHFSITGTSHNQKFRSTLSGSYSYDDNHLPGVDITKLALLLAPNAPALHNANGTLNWAPNAAGSSTWDNPLLYTNSSDFSNTTKNLFASANLSYKLMSGLEVISSFGYTSLISNLYAPTRMEAYRPEDRPFAQRSASFSSRNMNSWIIEPKLQYTGNIGKGKIEGMIGTTVQRNSSDVLTMYGIGYSSDLLMKSILAAASFGVVTSTSSMYKYTAGFGRLNYNWDDRYLISLNARRDGSSRFGDKNKFHNFWSAGIGWIFSNENWMKQVESLLSFGKLRASFGVTGNDQIGDYNYLSLYNTTGGIPYQGSPGLTTIRITNPHFQWEETEKSQLGIDLGFIKDRILLNATYALNRSSNQIIGYVLPSITGHTGIIQNFPATIRNTSWEFMLTTTNLNGKHFKWTSSFNLTLPANKLVKFPNIEKSSYASGDLGVIIGQPLDVKKTYPYGGVDQETGNYFVIDNKGNPTTKPDVNKDRTVLVSGLSKYYGGFQNTFTFKGFQLDLLFQFVRTKAPKELFYYNGVDAPGTFYHFASNQPVTVLDHWQKAGDKAPVARYTSLRSNLRMLQKSSDEWYTYDASYLRLKNASLSWQLPAFWLQKVKLQNARLYFNGQNLATISKYTGHDPESKNLGSLPPLQMWTLGAQIEL
jgi:TonB-dependent starch-binding outer membrane protein SusC